MTNENDLMTACDLREQNEAHPTISQWRDDDTVNVVVTFDESKEELWSYSQQEITHLKASVRNALGLEGDTHPTSEQIDGVFFGPNSELSNVLCKALGSDHADLQRFRSTLALQATFSISTLEMFERGSPFIPYAAMSGRKYVDACNLLSKGSMTSIAVGSRAKVPLWLQIERALNSTFRAIAIDDRSGNIQLALDDDKVYINSRTTDTQGLKPTTHVKDNRKGLVMLTCISSATDMPYGACWEKNGDSSQTCYKRILSTLFGNMVGENEVPYLSNVILCSDRGYWTAAHVFNYILRAHGDVHGTLKRAKCWPFTYDQHLGQRDRRTNVNTVGAPALFMKSTTYQNLRVTAGAFRSGTGNVSTFSSIHGWYQRDAQCLSEKLTKEYTVDVDDMLLPYAFQRLSYVNCKDTNYEEYADLLECIESVTPLTLTQG
ncbi:MAG: hypothetical protein ACREBR_02160, partial [bacterium]